MGGSGCPERIKALMRVMPVFGIFDKYLLAASELIVCLVSVWRAGRLAWGGVTNPGEVPGTLVTSQRAEFWRCEKTDSMCHCSVVPHQRM